MPRCRKCSTPFPNRFVIDGIQRNVGNRKFCLQCSPYKQHNTSKYGPRLEGKYCPHCKLTMPIDEFYTRGKTSHPTTYCRKCTTKIRVTALQAIKQSHVDYKGGKCEVCGYDRYIGALEFHHSDPDTKEFKISSKPNAATTDKVKAEMDKCRLLCSNCHREEHARLKGLFK